MKTTYKPKQQKTIKTNRVTQDPKLILNKLSKFQIDNTPVSEYLCGNYPKSFFLQLETQNELVNTITTLEVIPPGI